MPEFPAEWTTARPQHVCVRLRLFIFPALSPALALMSLVLGLNLLADALREISLKD